LEPDTAHLRNYDYDPSDSEDNDESVILIKVVPPPKSYEQLEEELETARGSINGLQREIRSHKRLISKMHHELMFKCDDVIEVLKE
jgi:hypothetical protein